MIFNRGLIWVVIGVFAMVILTCPMVPRVLAHEFGTTGKKSAYVSIPSSLPETWSKIQDEYRELNDVIFDKRGTEIYEIVFSIRDLVAAMPGKSKFSSHKIKKMKSEVSLVASLAYQFSTARDSGDVDKMEDLAKQLGVELRKIEGLYPAAALRK